MTHLLGRENLLCAQVVLVHLGATRGGGRGEVVVVVTVGSEDARRQILVVLGGHHLEGGGTPSGGSSACESVGLLGRASPGKQVDLAGGETA